jgi:geranylgeranyl diphosphate synthase type I
MDIKSKLSEIAKISDQKLLEFWNQEINKNFGFNQKQKDLIKRMLVHAQDHNLRPAKRLRAAFVYFGYLLGQKEINPEIYKAMNAVELAHTALLMQDDVMDQDDLRRGKETTHKHFGAKNLHYGESMAYTLGDVLLSFAYEELLKSDFEPKRVKEATLQLLRGIANTAFGQAYDITLETMDEWTEDDVIALHKAKTAIYSYENPLQIGAILGETNQETLNIISEFSMLGGVAFQLQDDILGVFGDTDKTGKSDNSDLIHGKRTLLILKALEMGNQTQKDMVLKAWNNVNATNEEITKAKKAIIDSGALAYSKQKATDLALEAISCTQKLRDLNLNSEAVDFIEGIAKYMIDREF